MLGRVFEALSGRGFGQRLPYAAALDSCLYRYRVHRQSPVETVWGDRLVLDSTDTVVSRYILDHSVFQPALTAFFRRFLEPGMTVVDVGAHIGYFTCLFADCVGSDGAVVAFEPARRNHSLLERNIRLNDYGTVETRRTAVADSAGPAPFHLDAGNTGHHSLLLSDQDAGRCTVDTVTLDATVDRDVDVVKIDAEGAEPRILRGFEDTLATHQPVVVLEYSRCWEDSLDAGLGPIRNAGYSFGYLDGERLVRGLSDVREQSDPVDIVAASRWPPHGFS